MLYENRQEMTVDKQFDIKKWKPASVFNCLMQTMLQSTKYLNVPCELVS